MGQGRHGAWPLLRIRKSIYVNNRPLRAVESILAVPDGKTGYDLSPSDTRISLQKSRIGRHSHATMLCAPGCALAGGEGDPCRSTSSCPEATGTLTT